ncbi:hypothetical protein SynBIOSU31_02083 [Synechococcus sp. BIOS-U3-1]|nr:hypothetical protein SynBIOSU31_02083 [Synechococcus sp. BIOS-U3-1]
MRINDLQKERDELLTALEQVALTNRSDQEHSEQCLNGRIARAGNSLILNLDELNSSTGIFFSNFEEFPDSTRKAVLRLLKQHHDLLVSQFQLHNLSL